MIMLYKLFQFLKVSLLLIIVGASLISTVEAKEYPAKTEHDSFTGPRCAIGEFEAVNDGLISWCLPNGSVPAKDSLTGCSQDIGFLPKPVRVPPEGTKSIWYCVPSAESLRGGGVDKIECPTGSNPYYADKGVVTSFIEGNPPLYCVANVQENQCALENRLKNKDGKYIGCIVNPTAIEYSKTPAPSAPVGLEPYNIKYDLPCQEIGGGTCVPTGEGGIAGYISRIYQFGLMLAGLTAFGAIVYGGINYILSAGNIPNLEDAKDQIKQAIVGLVLLLMAYLILYTINPDLVNLRNPDRPIIDIEQLNKQLTTPTYVKDTNTPGTSAPSTGETGCRLSVNPGITIDKKSGQINSGDICIGGCINGYTKNFEGGCIICSKAIQQGYVGIEKDCPPLGPANQPTQGPINKP